jgi:hypothetical protein
MTASTEPASAKLRGTSSSRPNILRSARLSRLLTRRDECHANGTEGTPYLAIISSGAMVMHRTSTSGCVDLNQAKTVSKLASFPMLPLPRYPKRATRRTGGLT